jgi:hypothetical protein
MHLSTEMKAIALIAIVVALILWSATAMVDGLPGGGGAQQSVRHR